MQHSASVPTSLVSRDKDILDLMNDADFRSRFPSLVLLDPVAFLETIRQRQAETAAESSDPPKNAEN